MKYFVKVFAAILLCGIGLVLSPTALNAQNREWQYIHQGNKAFRERQYQQAESSYRKALAVNADNSRALYNLGNVYLARHNMSMAGRNMSEAQRCDSIALDFYTKAAQQEKSHNVRAMAHHNRGYIFQRQAGETGDANAKVARLKEAIAAYKQALRENPESQSSRYNLALCQKQLKGSKGDGGSKNSKGGGGNTQKKSQQQQQPPKNQPLVNYARQAEKRTREKINNGGGQRALDKNW